MISLKVNHPDIERFISKKTDLNKVTKANMSVRVTDDFMKSVENESNYTINFDVEDTDEFISMEKDSNKILNKLAYANWYMGEPGCLFWDRIENWNLMSEHPDFEYAGTNPCVTGDNWVMTDNGVKQVKDLIGKETMIQLEGGYFNSTGFFNTGKKKVYKVITNRGYEIRLTDNHRLRTKNGWKEIKDLNEGDKIKINEIKEKYPNWDGKGTKEEGYLLGSLVGDGRIAEKRAILSVWERDYGSETIENFICECIKNSDLYDKHRSDFNFFQKPNNGRKDLKSVPLKILAKSFGIVKGNKTITDEIEQASSNFYIGFIRGFFDADGYVNDGNGEHSIRIPQSNLPLLKRLQRMLSRLGILSTIYKDRKKKETSLLPDGKGGKKAYKVKKSHEINISKESFFRFCGLIGSRHFAKLIKMNELVSNSKREPYKEDYFDDIISIKEDGKEDVYDIKVDIAKAFSCNGIVAHNCGEEPLPAGGSCNLSAINLTEFVDKPFTKQANFRMGEYSDAVQEGVTFLNNILDEGMDLHPLENQRESVRKWRQIGLGQMGLGSALIMMGIRYGSKESLAFCRSLAEIMINVALQQSAKLAKKDGPFPMYNESVLESDFFKENAWGITKMIVERYGLRNSQLLTIAPTGSTSNLVSVSGGIEPLFKTKYDRKTETLYDEDTTYKIFDPTVQELMRTKNIKDEKNLPGYVVDAHDIDYKERIDVQATWQQCIDASISSTINLSNSITVQDIKRLYQYAWKQGLKGVTVYRDGCAREGILTGESSGNKEEMTDQDFIDSMICPECKSNLEPGEGCFNCSNCTFTVCN